MRRIILSTVSGADLPVDLAVKHNVQVVPMHVIMEDQDYLDGSLPVQEIYEYYDRTKKYPLQRLQIPTNIKNFSLR